MTGDTSFKETLMKMAKKPQNRAVVAAYKIPYILFLGSNCVTV